jgi:hypothetical protein
MLADMALSPHDKIEETGGVNPIGWGSNKRSQG